MHKIPLHIETYGAGPALVLQHGFGGSARNFRTQARALSNGRRVVLFDARGHGRSSAPAEASAYALSEFVGDFAGVVEGSGPAPAAVGGLSMGAAVALHFVLRYPDRVAGLVLAAYPSSGEDERRREWALGFAQAIDERGLDAAGSEFAWGARSRFDPKGAALIRQGFLEHSPGALAHTLRELLAKLPSPQSLALELGRVKVPALVLVGADDRDSLEPCKALAEALPDAELRIVADAGHIVNLAQPAVFNAALEKFLRERVEPSSK